MSDTFYLTTPIYYVNAEPHLGHAYTTIVADTATRFARLRGQDARMQTGTDEHGDKIAEAAAKEGVEPKTYADRISGLFQSTWPPLHIAHDKFIRTTDPNHIETVRTILAKVHDAGDIYFAKYGGHYCVGCERFLTEKEMEDGKCPDHGTVPIYQEEENYFFRMSNYTDALREHIAQNPDFIRPERYKNEVLAMLDSGLEDLCISRPKTRLTWGIELPFDQNYVTYVWFDALINYMTGVDWPDGANFARYWPNVQHLIAKDILKPHGIYWPTMLMSLARAEGREPTHYLYQHLNVHGYWKVATGKMSKSRGNVVKPLELAQIYGVDAFRYFLLREMTFGLDAAFSEQALVERYNADLANDLGNLFSRVLNMLHKYRDGVAPEPGPSEDIDQTLLTKGDWARGEYAKHMEAFAFNQALAALWEWISDANKYVVATEPWALAKDPALAQRLDTVLYTLLLALARITILLKPVAPAMADQMAAALGIGDEVTPAMYQDQPAEKLLPPGAKTALPQALFPRVETKKVQAKAAKKEAKAKTKPAPKKEAPVSPDLISIEDFAKVQLKTGKVLSAEAVEGADKLLKLSVDLGEDSPRQIVAGIAQHYPLDDLMGKTVVVVANLKPAKLRGVESQGMLLAAVSKDAVRVVTPDADMPPGSKVR